jgi:hypothetical protein
MNQYSSNEQKRAAKPCANRQSTGPLLPSQNDPELTRHSDPTTARVTEHPAASPIDKIIGTYELLENVLSHLPMEELFRAQGISYKFQSTIRSSKTLQQNLFFAPRADAEPMDWVTIYPPGPLEDCPQLFAIPCDKTVQPGKANIEVQRREEALRKFYRKHFTEDHSYIYEMTGKQPTVLNPLLFEVGDATNYKGHSYLDVRNNNGIEAYRVLSLERTKSTSSAVKMLLTQPPVYEVRIRLGRIGVCVKNDCGLRVEDVMKKLEERGYAGQQKVEITYFVRAWAVFQFEKEYFGKLGTANRIELEKRVGEEWRG